MKTEGNWVVRLYDSAILSLFSYIIHFGRGVFAEEKKRNETKNAKFVNKY